MIRKLKEISTILALISTLTQAEILYKHIHHELILRQNYHFLTNFTISKGDVKVCHLNRTPEVATESIEYEVNLVKLGKNYITPEQLKMADIFFYQNESRDTLKDTTLSQFAFGVAGVKLISQSGCDYFTHRYDSYQDIKRAAGPQVNQELCLKQLEYLNERLNESFRLGVQSRDLNFAHYLEAFGKSTANMLVGDFFQVGSFDACKRMQIVVNKSGKYSATRYCVGSLRYKDWPADDPLDKLVTLKTGLCLPEACDSLNYKNKFQLIKRLSDYNARHQDFGDKMHLTAVYCPPDDKSELGAWWRSRPTLVTVSLTVLWLLVLVAATIIDEANKRKQSIKQRAELEQATDKIGFVATTSRATDNLRRICRSLSILSNFRSLFSTGESSMVKEGQKQQAVNAPTQPIKIVNLDVLEGIKVLAALYIISGHVIMLLTNIMNNVRELGTSRSIAWTMTNMMPAFAVNAFFVITGILTTYLMFKQNKSHSFITSPIKWVGFILYRYLRIMPMYAVVTLFCKHVARYIGDGPLWDYGTSSLSARRYCEQESWAWTILFGASFKSPLKHCIPTAWYLANDIQFCIVTPIFLVALHLRPRLGKALLVFFMLAGFVSGAWSILGSDIYDLLPFSQFKPHGFMVYVNFLHENYTQPQNRIPAYLLGLLLGHSLFEYEQRRKAHLERVESGEVSEDEASPGWSDSMTRYGPWFSLSVVVAVILTPSVFSRLSMTRDSGKLLMSIITPVFHLLYSAAVGIYVLLASTGQGNQLMDRFLSLNFWKPLSRLGLCVMLVNIEVITYITQTSRTTQHMDNYYLTSLNVMCFIYIYLVATVVCVLFEAPIRAALNHSLAYLMNHIAVKRKTQIKCD